MHLIADFHKADLDIWCHSGEENPVLQPNKYDISKINTTITI